MMHYSGVSVGQILQESVEETKLFTGGITLVPHVSGAVMLIVHFQVGISDASGQLLLWQVSSTTTSSEPFQVRRTLT